MILKKKKIIKKYLETQLILFFLWDIIYTLKISVSSNNLLWSAMPKHVIQWLAFSTLLVYMFYLMKEKSLTQDVCLLIMWLITEIPVETLLRGLIIHQLWLYDSTYYHYFSIINYSHFKLGKEYHRNKKYESNKTKITWWFQYSCLHAYIYFEFHVKI